MTERLILTPIQASDFSDLCGLFGELEFTRHIFGRALGPEEVWFRTLRDIGHWQAVGYGNWAARLKEGNALVGTFGVFDYRRDMTPPFDAPELGWGLAPRHQRVGLASEALSAALAWCDECLNAARTVCMISPGNGPSHVLADRAGFVPYAETRYKDSAVILLSRPGPLRQGPRPMSGPDGS